RVRIESLDIAFEPPDILVFRTRCSGGTYIRSLAQDLGAQIGCGAHLAELRREGSGALTLDDAVSLDLLENLPPEERQRYLLPTDLPIMALPRLELQADAATGLRQGRELFVSTPSACGESRAYGPGDQFLGVVTVEPGGRVKALRLLATQPAMDGRP
ncbi:MAG: tRNA pseudouridine(55) synthase TruB, partial [Burkholderiales bacterium]|nr:tRNA pseudouridine(55) synthase TruB [Burkholderiales bacterium]